MSEKRRSKRIPNRVAVELQQSGIHFAGRSEDLSLHGVRVRTDMPSISGDAIALELSAPGQEKPLQIKGHVAWERKHGPGQHEIGVQLDDPSPLLIEHLLAQEGVALREQLENTPAMPLIILDLMALLNESRTAVRDIEERLRADQVLVAYLLKLANSPLYGVRQNISTIGAAIHVLGFATLRSHLMTFFSRQLNRLSGSRKQQQYYFRHALACGLIARALAALLHENPEEAYVAGLLHDLGKPVMGLLSQVNYETLHSDTQAEPDRQAVEWHLLGYSHVELGFYLMNHWHFSERLIEPLRFHHRPQEYHGQEALIPLVALADRLARQCLEGHPLETTPLTARLGLSTSGVEQAVASARDQLDTYLSI